jgi:hypothetical protein
VKTATLAALLLCSCASTWNKYPHSLYSALRSETPQAIIAHHKLLERLLREAEAAGRNPPPGISAEYAYYSWKVGKPELAAPALADERTHYPQSEKFVALLERFLPSVPVIDPVDEEGRQR